MNMVVAFGREDGGSRMQPVNSPIRQLSVGSSPPPENGAHSYFINGRNEMIEKN